MHAYMYYGYYWAYVVCIIVTTTIIHSLLYRLHQFMKKKILAVCCSKLGSDLGLQIF